MNSIGERICPWLTLAGGFALFGWALCVSLGTGLGYDHPITGLFDGGVSSLWQIFKAVFLGILAVATAKVGAEALEREVENTKRSKGGTAA